MTEHRNPSAAEARHGTLDVPLTVWQVADAASLTAGLFAEFKPTRGPIVAVDVPGWETIPCSARHSHQEDCYQLEHQPLWQHSVAKLVDLLEHWPQPVHHVRRRHVYALAIWAPTHV